MTIRTPERPVSNVGDGRRGPGCCAAHGTWEADVREALPGTISAALRFVPSLTARERDVFQLLGIGYDNHSIARRMFISERTTKRHVTGVLIKLGLESRLQAGMAAMAMTLIAAKPTCDRVAST